MVSKYFENKGNWGVKCNLCPNFCLLKEGEVGKCGVRKCKDKQIYLSEYGFLNNVSIDFIEDRFFKHFLQDSKILSIGGIGCSLACVFCQNYITSQEKIHIDEQYFSPEYLIKFAIRNNCSGICMTYNEPIIYFEYLLDVAHECHRNGLKFILKTNAYINKEPWKDICIVSDAINIDWKGTESQYREIAGASDYVIEERIREAYNRTHLEITIPAYDTFLSDMRLFFRCGNLLSSLNVDIPCHLIKVHPTYKYNTHTVISEVSFKLALDILSFSMNTIYIYD